MQIFIFLLNKQVFLFQIIDLYNVKKIKKFSFTNFKNRKNNKSTKKFLKKYNSIFSKSYKIFILYYFVSNN